MGLGSGVGTEGGGTRGTCPQHFEKDEKCPFYSKEYIVK